MSGNYSGILTTVNHQLPAGLDGTRIAQWKMRGGVSYQELKGMIASAFDDFNAELLDTYGDLVTVTENDAFEYPNGGTVQVVAGGSSGSRANNHAAPITGHMIDLLWWQESLIGDGRFFRDARMSVIEAQVKYIVQAFRDTWETQVLTRFFTTTENQLGSNGWDVPFANANPNKNASNGIDFIPMKWGGQTFDDTHTHYLGFNSSSSKTFADVFAGLAKTINEHGNNGPYTAYVSEADVTTIQALTNYIRPTNTMIGVIDRGGATSGNQFFMDGNILGSPALGGRFIGAYDTGYGICGLYANYRLPTGYVGMYKSYGQLDVRNPLAIRIHPVEGFGVKISEIPSFETTYPLKEVLCTIEFGVSCNKNRTLGAAGYLVAGGTWANPTIS